MKYITFLNILMLFSSGCFLGLSNYKTQDKIKASYNEGYELGKLDGEINSHVRCLEIIKENCQGK